jgi:hypothetical protein
LGHRRAAAYPDTGAPEQASDAPSLCGCAKPPTACQSRDETPLTDAGYGFFRPMGPPRHRAVCLALLAAGLWPAVGGAHDADMIYAQLSRAAGEPTVVETMTMTAASLERLAPVDADQDRTLTQADLDARQDAIEVGLWGSAPLSARGARCRVASSQARLREGFVELTARFACGPGELSQVFKLLQVLPSTYRVQVASLVDGKVEQHVAQGNLQTLVFAAAAQVPKVAPPSRAEWAARGARGAVTTVAPLAILAALLLAAASLGRALTAAASFALGQGTALTVAALGLASLSGRSSLWFEALVAVAIAWLAVENLAAMAPRYREVLALGVGVAHGFAAGPALVKGGLTWPDALWLCAGAIAVQAAAAAALFPAVRFGRRWPGAMKWVVRAGSLAVVAASAAGLAFAL